LSRQRRALYFGTIIEKAAEGSSIFKLAQSPVRSRFSFFNWSYTLVRENGVRIFAVTPSIPIFSHSRRVLEKTSFLSESNPKTIPAWTHIPCLLKQGGACFSHKVVGNTYYFRFTYIIPFIISQRFTG